VTKHIDSNPVIVAEEDLNKISIPSKDVHSKPIKENSIPLEDVHPTPTPINENSAIIENDSANNDPKWKNTFDDIVQDLNYVFKQVHDKNEIALNKSKFNNVIQEINKIPDTANETYNKIKNEHQETIIGNVYLKKIAEINEEYDKDTNEIIADTDDIIALNSFKEGNIRFINENLVDIQQFTNDPNFEEIKARYDAANEHSIVNLMVIRREMNEKIGVIKQIINLDAEERRKDVNTAWATELRNYKENNPDMAKYDKEVEAKFGRFGYNPLPPGGENGEARKDPIEEIRRAYSTRNSASINPNSSHPSINLNPVNPNSNPPGRAK
jgi:hypothetical protein